MSNGDLSDSVIKEIDRQIDTREKDDPIRLMLCIMRANSDALKQIKRNPLVKMGEFMEAYPGIFGAILFILYVLSLVIPGWLLRLVGWDPLVLIPK